MWACRGGWRTPAASANRWMCSQAGGGSSAASSSATSAAEGATPVPPSSTVDDAEVRKFGSLAQGFWDPSNAMFAPLHTMNAVRVPLVVAAAGASWKQPQSEEGAATGATTSEGKPLQDLNVLDVGCGGGVLSEVRE